MEVFIVLGMYGEGRYHLLWLGNGAGWLRCVLGERETLFVCIVLVGMERDWTGLDCFV